MKSIRAQARRFIIAGLVNTAATYLLYLLLLGWTGHVAAFTLSFIVGIVFAFVLNGLYVFHVDLDWRKLVAYPVIYGFQYVAGLALLVLLVDYMGFDKRLAPLINVAILTPVTFLLNKWFLLQPI